MECLLSGRLGGAFKGPLLAYFVEKLDDSADSSAKAPVASGLCGLPALELTDVELETAARACRALARQEEQAAKRMDNPGMRGPIENTVKRAAAPAEKFEPARRCHGK